MNSYDGLLPVFESLVERCDRYTTAAFEEQIRLIREIIRNAGDREQCIMKQREKLESIRAYCDEQLNTLPVESTARIVAAKVLEGIAKDKLI